MGLNSAQTITPKIPISNPKEDVTSHRLTTRPGKSHLMALKEGFKKLL